MSNLDIVLRLILGLILGGIIGAEREFSGRPAGFRTHALVCIGSALIMIVSTSPFGTGLGAVVRDPGRIAAQVISGIGFLGAGTIIHEGASVKGLTTAASLWVSAGIGLAVGAGLFFPAVISTLLALFSLSILRYYVEKKWFVQKINHRLNVHVQDRPGQLGKVSTYFGSQGINIKNVTFSHDEKRQTINIEFLLRLPPGKDLCTVVTGLADVDGVLKVEQD